MNTSHIVIRPPKESEFLQVLRLRYKVLDQPVGLPEKTRPGNSDMQPSTIHQSAFDSAKLICTVRLDLWKEDEYLVRRMATDPEYQRRGIGARVLMAAESKARQRGVYKILLHSRLSAVGFYKKLGYQLTGQTEIHDGDENLEMVKTLSRGSGQKR